jgi:hypothetical protein
VTAIEAVFERTDSREMVAVRLDALKGRHAIQRVYRASVGVGHSRIPGGDAAVHSWLALRHAQAMTPA